MSDRDAKIAPPLTDADLAWLRGVVTELRDGTVAKDIESTGLTGLILGIIARGMELLLAEVDRLKREAQLGEVRHAEN